MKKTFYDFFSELNQIPRPSHYEDKVADYLCNFAQEHGLEYMRDAQNCVVIKKPASAGYENAEPVVILNHMDMVCVAKDGYLRNGKKFNHLTDPILPYVETDEKGARWMKAEGTSLGADNGMGLSMALAILADDSLEHPALEVLTTTNEEDGMSGAEALSLDFIKGRKVINLDSEAYDEITVGAAGACLQIGKWDLKLKKVPKGCNFFRITIEGGLGGHSGVDINKGRANCIVELSTILSGMSCLHYLCSFNGGTANASIPSWAEAIVAVKPKYTDFIVDYPRTGYDIIRKKYADKEPGINIRIEPTEPQDTYIDIEQESVINYVLHILPFGVQQMREDMPGTVMTSNNIGVIKTEGNQLTISTHTRSFDNNKQKDLSSFCKEAMLQCGAKEVEMLMDTSAWMEREDSPLLELTCQTFKDVLGFEPKKVAMHFVLEAAYYVKKYPGIEMASIGPLIIEPHSTSERVNLDTADNIWKVTIELLKRMKA
ncbi:MAG: beta-Ala-His dipeptidase [Bacteroidales bacterium]|nr:beta-Ala-His dipeptidase [Candidatus Minthousia equi]